MEIKIQCNEYVLSISIGYKTEWFEQIPFICISKEFYVEKNIVYAKWIYDLPHKKFERKNI